MSASSLLLVSTFKSVFNFSFLFQLRQYESRGDLFTRNIIDLKDLESVQRIESVSSPPKTASLNAYFEVRSIAEFVLKSKNPFEKFTKLRQKLFPAVIISSLKANDARCKS